MSGFFGIFNRKGKNIKKENINTMLNAISFWNPDEQNTWEEESIVLGHTMHWNTPESRYEHLPLQKNPFVLTMDARIDNRDELLKELELPDRPLEEIGDSEFILEAYRKWGEDCPKYLLGDFSFSIWDEEKKQLFCVRDHIGIKPFYYYLSDDLFVFSNDIRGVISNSSVPKTFNEKAIAIYLKVAGLLHKTYTMFKHIRKLPPATILIVSDNKIKEYSYWSPEKCPRIHYDTIEDYIHALRSILEKSISCRIRSDYSIYSHLSGGLDSSYISVLASRILCAQGKKLYSFSWVPTPDKDDDPSHYEWANSIQIAKEEGIEHEFINLDENDIYKIFTNLDLATNDTTDLWYEFPLREKAKSQGIRTILSGWGGDELITYGGAGYYTGKFWKEKKISVIIELLSISKKTKRPFRNFIGQIYRHIVLPILPGYIFCRMPRSYCSKNKYTSLIHPSFKNHLNFNFSYAAVAGRKGIHERQLALFNFGHLNNRTESWAASSPSVEYRYPLLDKRVVEFALGIPEKLYFQNGIGRYLYRMAAKGILPDDIRWQNNKLELTRVNHYLNVSMIAQKKWKDYVYKNEINLTDQSYINIKTLMDIIDSNKTENMDSMIEKSDGVGLAILLLRMGQSFLKDNVIPISKNKIDL